jgi:hypothetical protein
MVNEARKNKDTSPSVEEDAGMGETDIISQKLCFSRYNSPFWQIVVVSFVAFG